MIKKITTINDADLTKISQIWLEANIEAHAFVPESYWQDHYLTIKELLPQATLFLAYQQQEIVGFLGLMGDHIAGIFVTKEARGHGYGQKLLAAAKAERSTLTLEVYQKNASARQFYFKTGFQITNESFDDDTNELELAMTWRRSD